MIRPYCFCQMNDEGLDALGRRLSVVSYRRSRQTLQTSEASVALLSSLSTLASLALITTGSLGSLSKFKRKEKCSYPTNFAHYSV